MRPFFASVLLLVFGLAAGQEPHELRQKPITTAPGKVGELLRQWWKEGTAAGNVGDWYDNRDGGHSDLHLGPYPQLQRVAYTPDDVQARRHWARAFTVRPEVTFGNSSTSAPPTFGGSNPRTCYCSSNGLHLLARQYEGNNLYIYPEHRDHDPGHNGVGDGYGDLYPTNTPYLLISQGSSGSDQPFMRALPFTLAAFRPEVKDRLVRTGLLMPTIQMILRRTNKHLKSPDEYRTGKAHPSVFEGAWVDELAMVTLAHQLSADRLPPRVRLKVLEEETFESGRDFFDAVANEKLADTPAVIARVVRAHPRERRLVVSAAESTDENGHPLTFHWVVLRAGGSAVRITPRKKDASVVELIVPYPERRPIAPGSAMESNRIDIGVFVNNGFHDSAPGFVTFFGLDSEARVYDTRGRIAEIGYGMGETRYAVTDWARWAAQLAAAEATGFKLSAEERAAIERAVSRHAELRARAAHLQEGQKRAEVILREADEAWKKAGADPKGALADPRKRAEADLREIQKKAQAAAAAERDLLEGKGAELALRPFVEARLRAAARNPRFLADLMAGPRWREAPDAARNAITAALKEYTELGYDEPGGTAPTTAYDQAQLERVQAVALCRVVFPGTLTASYLTNMVDPRLTAPKRWRDVYRYHTDGTLLGWTRHGGPAPQEFDSHGLLVLEKDRLGRCTRGREVAYHQEPSPRPGLNANPLRPRPTSEVVQVRYGGDTDYRGRIVRNED